MHPARLLGLLMALWLPLGAAEAAGEAILSEPRDRTTVAATDQAPSAPAPIAPGQLQRAAASVAFD